MPLVDVHCHLTHEHFLPQVDQVVARARAAGLAAMVVNGLNPETNRQVLALAEQYPEIKPALGIYPVDAVGPLIKDLPYAVSLFDRDDEVTFIESQLAAGKAFAIGECGLDGYWVPPELFAAQEAVFEQLIGLSLRYDTPLIIHTRKRETRAMEMLKHFGVKRVNFHCYGGKVRPALQAAEQEGWYFSIPANARRNEAFSKMLRSLPPERILTETDAPYLPAAQGEKSEPCHVAGTVAYLAELRQLTLEDATDLIWQNYCRFFGCQ